MCYNITKKLKEYEIFIHKNKRKQKFIFNKHMNI